MEKIWVYGFVFMLGMVAGIILWERIGVDDVFKGTVRFKQKGKGNKQDPQINQETPPKRPKRAKRKERRNS